MTYAPEIHKLAEAYLNAHIESIAATTKAVQSSTHRNIMEHERRLSALNQISRQFADELMLIPGYTYINPFLQVHYNLSLNQVVIDRIGIQGVPSHEQAKVTDRIGSQDSHTGGTP